MPHVVYNLLKAQRSLLTTSLRDPMYTIVGKLVFSCWWSNQLVFAAQSCKDPLICFPMFSLSGSFSIR